MNILLAVTIAQLGDLVTWLPAITRNPAGELWPAAHVAPETVVLSKLAILAIVTGLWVFRRRTASRKYAALVSLLVLSAITWGLFGTATNVIGGGLL